MSGATSNGRRLPLNDSSHGYSLANLNNTGRSQTPYLHGIALFNSAQFFEAHEVLEDVWREAPEPERKFLQGLIQAAVALHHYSRGNRVGCRSLLGRAGKNLSVYPDGHGGVDLQAFRHCLQQWCEALDQSRDVPALPRIDRR